MSGGRKHRAGSSPDDCSSAFTELASLHAAKNATATREVERGSGDWSPSNPAAAITAVESIKTDIKSAWANLGYPAADLLFLFMVSHPIDAGDASLTVLRTYAQNYYANSNDTLFVNLNDIAPFTTITTNNWYDSAGTAHLDEATRGYEAISSRIVSNILRYAP